MYLSPRSLLSIFAVSIVMLHFGCGYLATPRDPANIESEPSVTVPDTYATLRAEVLTNKCLGCHYAGGIGPGDFTTYAGTMTKVTAGQPNSSLLYTRANGNSSPMPMTGRESAVAARIYNWIANGAPEN